MSFKSITLLLSEYLAIYVCGPKKRGKLFDFMPFLVFASLDPCQDKEGQVLSTV